MSLLHYILHFIRAYSDHLKFPLFIANIIFLSFTLPFFNNKLHLFWHQHFLKNQSYYRKLYYFSLFGSDMKWFRNYLLISLIQLFMRLVVFHQILVKNNSISYYTKLGKLRDFLFEKHTHIHTYIVFLWPFILFLWYYQT